MNLALGGLLIFLLLIPGGVFRIFLIKSESFENPLDTSKIAEITFVLVPALVIHYCGYHYVMNYSDYNVRLDQLYYLISGKGETKLELDKIIQPSFLPFLRYIFTLSILGALTGYIFKKIILYFYLDLKYNIFSITNEWDNLLSSREFIYERKLILWKRFIKYSKRFIKGNLSFRRLLAYSKILKLYKKSLPIDWIQIDLLVRTTKSDILYQGVLHKYYLSKGNSLDKIYLREVFKKEHSFFSKDEGFQHIPTDILVFKGVDIININVTYLKAEVL